MLLIAVAQKWSLRSPRLSDPFQYGKALPEIRAAILRSWASLMREHVEELAILITSDQGNAIAEASS
ncbi:hypothetical protein CO683_41050 [Bradyrhizobium ottawaense]|uniref:aldehyde dehydrogenase family protein n=1 Tax=Bradyrhizobium ottawaense TaxID=931866 RepID=UPI000BEAE5F9|nr:aldehyde dehydrogenase family protein [Bradyrhizobium ottawaense]PDT63988.1 hypothetical protein CO683_41050 [Bradyrhizobium ottawaense]